MVVYCAVLENELRHLWDTVIWDIMWRHLNTEWLDSCGKGFQLGIGESQQ